MNVGTIYVKCPECGRELTVEAVARIVHEPDGMVCEVYPESVTGCPHVDGPGGGGGEPMPKDVAA